MATLTTTVTESVTLNGHTYGNSRTKTFTDVTQVIQQNVIIDTNEFTLYAEKDNAESTTAGEFDAEKTQYVRITNLSSSINLLVHVDEADAAKTVILSIKPGCSMVMGTLDDGIDLDDDADITTPGMTDITKITLEAVSSSVEVEYFIASQSAV